jgi:hypothetical protein
MISFLGYHVKQVLGFPVARFFGSRVIAKA